MSAPEPTIWRHVLPSIKHEGWAIVLMDSSGYFSAVSDFGNYAYKWSSFTGDFRKFLIGVDASYLLGKISERSEFDDKRTQQIIKDRILSARKDRSWTREEAREEWDLAESVEDLLSFHAWHDETRFEDSGEFGSRDYPGQAWGFAKHIWPRLCAIWRTELGL